MLFRCFVQKNFMVAYRCFWTFTSFHLYPEIIFDDDSFYVIVFEACS